MSDYFSQEHLLRLLTRAPNATWRFDVDVSLEAAVRMARFAHDYADVHGMFFICPTLETYNVFAPSSQIAIEEIARYEHQIAVHAALDIPADPLRNFRRARRLLVPALATVDVFVPDRVAWHKPTPDLLWRDFEGYDSMYAARWKGRYLSDARRRWDAEKDARVADDMQICLHAEHWDLR